MSSRQSTWPITSLLLLFLIFLQRRGEEWKEAEEEEQEGSVEFLAQPEDLALGLSALTQPTGRLERQGQLRPAL